MDTASDAAGLIAGMTQATKYLGVEWEALPQEQRSQLIDTWCRIIDERPSDAPFEIVASIAHHPALAKAWNKLDSFTHESRLYFIQVIVRNTLPVGDPKPDSREPLSN